MYLEKWHEHAEKLIFTARCGAISLFVPLLEKFPCLEGVESEHWDFLITIAGVFVGISQLNYEDIPDKIKNQLRDLTTQKLHEMYPDGLRACEDCTVFVDRTYDSLEGSGLYKGKEQFLFADSLGCWVVWNLLGYAPENDTERQLAHGIGSLLVQEFVDWWKIS